MDSFFSMEEIIEINQENTYSKKKEEPYMDETWERIVRRIFFLCRLKSININTLAIRSGITPSTLKSILYGKSKNPGIATLRHICDGLDISLEDFFHSRLFMEW